VTRRLLVAVLAGCLLAACSSGGGGAGPTETAAAPAPTGGEQRGVQAVIATDHGPAQLLVGTDAIFVGTHRGVKGLALEHVGVEELLRQIREDS